LPNNETDLRYFIEETKRASIFWIANKGKREVHFIPTWIMNDDKPHKASGDRPLLPSPRIHISPDARLYLIPPSDFKELILTEIRIGPDTGEFIDIETRVPK
jgi:hypothetical protein